MNTKNKRLGVIVMSTFPDEKSGLLIAERLINKRLCACVNLTKIRSLYSWKNKLEDHEEYLGLFKSTTSAYEELKSNIEEVHPYEVPEIIELKMNQVSKSYMSWLVESTNKNEKNKKNLKRGRSLK
ncbi:MAG: divalent-cation tolerance protein CutA [Thermoproteota archaeon]|jgi:periplasmic divalent cation tolerance protein|nr:divalent-cation tolerance protein CutA [Thermoproteota archaeon]